MAVTVPRYEQGQVGQQNLPNARYSAAGADTNADAIGRGLQQVGGLLGQIAVDEGRRVDTAAVMEAESELRQYQNTMLFGDGSGQNIGAFGTKGKDAFGLPERVLPELEKKRNEIAGRLRGGQRSMFENRTADWGPQTQGDLLRHVAREADDYTKQTTKAYIDSSSQTALLYYNDPKRVDAEIQRAQDAYIVGNPGDPPEATRVALQTIDSKVRTGIVQRLMTESPSAAQAYYQQYREKFTGGDQADIERVLTPLAKADQGEQMARSVLEGNQYGVQGDYVSYRRTLESGGRADAKNPNSSAAGADQFIDSTWLQMVAKENPSWAAGKSKDEILAMRFDPEKSGEMAAALDRDNAAALAAAGQQATNENLYAMHHFGPGAGVKFAQASVDTPMSDLLSEAQIKANPYLRGMTKGDAIANWNSRAGAGGGQSAPRSFADARQYIIDTVEDDAVRKSALSFIDVQEALTKQREAETEKSMIEAINSKVEQADPSMPFSKIVTPQELAWAQQTGRVAAWENRLKSRVSGENDDTPRDQLLAYRDVVYQAARGDKAAQRELAKYRPYDPKLRMAQSDRDWLAKSQADILSGDPAKQAKAASEGEINQIIKRYSMNTLGVTEKKLATDPKAVEFDQQMRLWADDFQRQNQRAPTYTEVLKQADLMTLNQMQFTYEKPGLLFGTNEVEATVADLGIPVQQQAQIVEALRAEGKPVTGQTVAAKWQAYLKATRQ